MSKKLLLLNIGLLGIAIALGFFLISEWRDLNSSTHGDVLTSQSAVPSSTASLQPTALPPITKDNVLSSFPGPNATGEERQKFFDSVSKLAESASVLDV